MTGESTRLSKNRDRIGPAIRPLGKIQAKAGAGEIGTGDLGTFEWGPREPYHVISRCAFPTSPAVSSRTNVGMRQQFRRQIAALHGKTAKLPNHGAKRDRARPGTTFLQVLVGISSP